MLKKSELKNGLRLVTNHMPYADSASVGIWIAAGGRYENKTDKGIAHVVEHLSFKGAKNYSAKEIKETIEGLGGSLNAFTSEEFTCYLTKILSKHLPLALNVLSDMALHPLFMPKDIEKEKAVILEEIKMYRDLPQSYVHELLDELLWAGHPLGMNLAGTPESVSALSREDLFSFHGKFHHPGNIVVSVAGNVEHEKLLADLTRIFAKSYPGKKVNFSKWTQSAGAKNTEFFYKETEQTHLALGYLSFERDHPDRHALSLLHVILGANMSSRLFNEVREKKGLCYEIGTQVKRLIDTGAFVVHAGVDNHKPAQAMRIILKELRKISTKSVTKSEFFRAKEYYRSQLLMSLEDTLDHMIWIGEQESASGKIKTTREVLDEIDKVKIDDLLRVAEQIFQVKDLRFALIGPQKDKEKNEIVDSLAS